jgi:hypothetical protein
MTSDQDVAIEHGMKLAMELPDIMPQQADARLKAIYEDIQQAFRVPVINQVFRTLANYPDYLEQAWNRARPIAHSFLLERAGDDLRAQALVKDAPVSAVLDLSEVADAEKLQAFSDTIHYVLPKLLLVITLFYESSFGEGGDSTATPEEALQPIPAGMAEGTTKVEMVDPKQAGPQLHQLFEDIKARHGHSLVSSYYRGLGQWPDFLQSAWERVGPYVGTAEYTASRLELIDAAQSRVRGWPIKSAHPSPSHHNDVRDILLAFQCKFIPEMLLDAALINTFTGGREAALKSRFSLTS